MIVQHEVNMSLGYFASTAVRDSYMTSSYVYYTSNLIWMIPPGREISSIEKLLKPFQMTVWVYFLLVLGITLLVVAVLKFQSKEVQIFFFGAGVQSPCLNFVNLILGGSLHKLPVRNFARTVLLIFMLYCFVMQNSYKGGLNKFMQMTIREPEMKSTDQMMKNNFKFYMLTASKAYLAELPRVMESAVFTNPANFAKMVEKVLDPEFKGAVLTSKDHLAYRNIIAFPRFFRHAPETIFTNNIVVYMRKQACLSHQINQIIINSLNGGLIQTWASHYIDKNFLNHKRSPKAVALKMQQLLGAFQLLILGLFISLAFFVGEKISPQIKSWFCKSSD